MVFIDFLPMRMLRNHHQRFFDVSGVPDFQLAIVAAGRHVILHIRIEIKISDRRNVRVVNLPNLPKRSKNLPKRTKKRSNRRRIDGEKIDGKWTANSIRRSLARSRTDEQSLA